MKNRLLIAFLTFTAIPCVADNGKKITWENLFIKKFRQPNNTELLTHLKNVQTQIKDALEDCNLSYKQPLQEELGSQYITIVNLWNDILPLLNTSDTQLIHSYFNLIQTHMISLYDCMELFNHDDEDTIVMNMYQDLILSTNNQNLFEQFDSIFKKHSINRFELIFVGGIIRYENIFITLLEKIENKIKELEKQI